MRRILLAFALLAAACQCPPGPGTDPADAGPGAVAVARVNGSGIPRADFEAALRHAERSLAEGEAAPPHLQAQLAARILDKMIGDELLVQHARSLGLVVQPGELEYRLESIKQSGGGEQAFERFLADSALAPERVRLNLERNLLLEKLAARMRSELAPTDEAALRQAYQERCRRSGTGAGTLALAHVLFTGPDEEAQRRAARVRAEILAGLDFAVAARAYSDDAATREVGGSLGRLAPDDLLPELAAAVAGLAEGAVSDPVRSPAGVHLLRLEARSEVPDFSGLRAELERELLDRRTREAMEQLAVELAGRGRVERLDN